MPPCLAENTVVAFADGRLGADEIASVDTHVAGCPDCRRLVAAALDLQTRERATGATGSAAFWPLADQGAALPRGTTVGRYTILGLAGRGGMGEVYAAYDAELDRKVAFKVLRSRANDTTAQARLLREARAMAKLSHTNVVTVHDAGTSGERVFVAMEFVDGVTLREWLAERKRNRAEILAAFTQAARGLAAAHAAGLVHRDFKPGNVMVARDGSVRVLDFGLARHLGDEARAPEPKAPALPDASDEPKAATLTLTATGELLGTPRYMAPEQMRAAATDARTDQFSFCVALYEALYGDAPFSGASLRELMPEVLAGRVRPPPATANVPAWLRRVLLRGLSVAPDARWASMNALVVELARDPTRARRRWGLAAGVLALVALSGATLIQNPMRAASLCRGGASRLAGIWEPAGVGGATRPRHEATRRAFLASGAPAPAEVWERVEPLLDRYVAGWLAMYTNACEATQLRHEQPAAVLDLRMTCLAERRTALGALTDLLVTADRGVVTKAVDAVNALPSLDRCADVAQLRAPVEPPRDQAMAARVDDVRKRAAVAKALSDTGKHGEALNQLKTLTAEATTIGYQPLLAELLDSRPKFQGGPNYSPEVVPVGEQAVWVAIASARDDLAADAAVDLVANVGCYQARLADGWRWARMAHALLRRLQGRHDLADAWLLHNEAVLDMLEKHPRLALDRLKESVSLKKKALGPEHPDVAIGLNSVGEALHRLESDAEAMSVNEEVLRIFSKAYGPTSTYVCMALSNRGEYMVALDQCDESVPILSKAATCWEAQVGADHQFIAYPLTALGRALLATRVPRPAEAVPVLERALRIREAHEPDAALVAETRDALAKARLAARATAPTRRRKPPETAP